MFNLCFTRLHIHCQRMCQQFHWRHRNHRNRNDSIAAAGKRLPPPAVHTAALSHHDPAESQGAHRILARPNRRTGDGVRALQVPDATATLRDRRHVGADRASGEGVVPEQTHEVQAGRYDGTSNRRGDVWLSRSRTPLVIIA